MWKNKQSLNHENMKNAITTLSEETVIKVAKKTL